jgi:hypothetical protein
MYSINFLKKNKIKFREDLRLNEDLYFNFVAFNSTKNIVQVHEVTYFWMYNANSTTTKDKSTDFIKYNISQSILSSTYAIIDLAKKNKNKLDEMILATKLINIYTISQEALYYNISLDSFKDEYKLLANELDVYAFVKNNANYFANKLEQVNCTLDGKYYYYQQTFIEFIKNAYNIIKEE